MKEIIIDGKKIGLAHSPYVVAEISANHNGDIEEAKKLMLSAKQSGADAIKMQTYTPDTITLQSNNVDFKINEGLWKGYTLYDLYKEAHTPYEWHKPLFEYARKIKLTCFSTPFDETAVDLLEDLNTPAYKIASFEAIDIPLIKYVAATKKPMIISTGMANLEEISEAVDAAKVAGCKDLILLHCISAYPAPADQSNLLTIPDLAKRFGVLAGLSDHTLGTLVSTTSVALGSVFIEKHFTLDRSIEGPDSSFSLEPEELTKLVDDVKMAYSALGIPGYERKEAEVNNVIFRRSIYVVKDLKVGDVLSKENIRRVRPGNGLNPKHFEGVIGVKVNCNILKNTPLNIHQLVGYPK
ncbi:MAG: N-acetylneuraminate synthase [Bermanella sp.]|jgi:N-acetylneuraminate synthase